MPTQIWKGKKQLWQLKSFVPTYLTHRCSSPYLAQKPLQRNQLPAKLASSANVRQTTSAFSMPIIRESAHLPRNSCRDPWAMSRCQCYKTVFLCCWWRGQISQCVCTWQSLSTLTQEGSIWKVLQLDWLWPCQQILRPDWKEFPRTNPLAY